MLTQGRLVLLWLAGANAQSCRDFVVKAQLDLAPSDFAVAIEDFETGRPEWKAGPFNETLNVTTITELTCLNPEKCWKVTVSDYLRSKKEDGYATDDLDFLPQWHWALLTDSFLSLAG
jgi:hypothetical protein